MHAQIKIRIFYGKISLILDSMFYSMFFAQNKEATSQNVASNVCLKLMVIIC